MSLWDSSAVQLDLRLSCRAWQSAACWSTCPEDLRLPSHAFGPTGRLLCKTGSRPGARHSVGSGRNAVAQGLALFFIF